MLYGCLGNPIQILCDHYHYLIGSMDPNEIAGDKFLKSILIVNELNILLHFPINYMKNSYILEHIRSLETTAIFLFIDALKEIDSQKCISDTLLKGKPVF